MVCIFEPSTQLHEQARHRKGLWSPPALLLPAAGLLLPLPPHAEAQHAHRGEGLAHAVGRGARRRLRPLRRRVGVAAEAGRQLLRFRV